MNAADKAIQSLRVKVARLHERQEDEARTKVKAIVEKYAKRRSDLLALYSEEVRRAVLNPGAEGEAAE